MRKRRTATLPLYRHPLADLPTSFVKVEALVGPSPDGSEWEVGPVDCVEWLTEQEVEWAKDLLAEAAQKEEMCR